MNRSSRRIAWLAGTALALAAGPSGAHGPTVRITAEAAEPAELRIQRGEMVHFVNDGPVAVRVRGAEDSFHSPVLAPGDAGWHLPFRFPGTFPYRVEPEGVEPEGVEPEGAKPGGADAVRGAIVVESPD